MLKKDFVIMAVMTSLETIFFNEALFEGNFLFAGFWGFMLGHHLVRVYRISKFTRTVLEITKKKD